MPVQQSHQQDLVKIYNPTNKDFTVKWAGIPRTLGAKQEATHPRFLAEHFAKKLADFVLQVQQYQYKKQHGKDIALVRNKKHRTRVLNVIIRGVDQYFLPVTPDGQVGGDDIQPLTPEEQRTLIDIGDVKDDVLGETIDSIEIDLPPEAIPLDQEMTKAQIKEQLSVLGIDYKESDSKDDLLKKLGVPSQSPDQMTNKDLDPQTLVS